MPLKNTTTTNVDDTQAEVGLGLGVPANVTGNIPDEAEEETDYRPRTELSLLDVEKKRAFESEVKRNNRATTFWNVMIIAIPVFLTFIGLIIAVYVGIFTYYLTSVSEPMGSLKNEIGNLKEEVDEVKQDYRDLRNKNNSITPVQ
jgi:hypothetical protein